MRSMTTALLAGAAIVGVTGLALAAGANSPMTPVHVMTVQMLDGGVAQIRYTGNVAPKLNVVQTAQNPFAAAGFGGPSPFVEIARMQALMDRQMTAIMIQAQQMHQAAMSDPLYGASLNSGGNGMNVATTGVNFCMRSVQVTASPNGGAPKVVTHTEGNCGEGKQAAGPSTTSSTSPNPTSSNESLQSISYHPTRVSPRPRQGI